MDDNFEIDGFVKQREELERLMMSNPQMEKRVQGLIRKVLMQARRAMGQQAQSAMKTDPRQAYKAVKTSVYRQILGGSVSILQKRKRGTQFSAYEPPRTLRPGQRGGNRLSRSQRTYDIMHYAGPDRGFILRFVNAGTNKRTTMYGNRGSLSACNFFGNRSHQEMRNAADNLSRLIDELIKQELK